MAYANKNVDVFQSRSLLATAMNGNQVQNAAGGFYNPTSAYPNFARNWPGYNPQGWSSQTAWAPSSNIATYGLTNWVGSPPHSGLGRLGTLSTTVAALPTWQKVAGAVVGLWVLKKLLG